MASLIAASNDSHYFSNTCLGTQRGTLFKAKKLAEFKTPTSVRIQVYPTLDSTAPSAEVEHAFKTGRQAVINTPTIHVQEGLVLIAQRLDQSVQFGMVLHDHTDYLNTALFDPANFSNEHYANSAGNTLIVAVHPVNQAFGHTRCLKPMVLAGTAA